MIDVRFRILKNKDSELFLMMKKFPEVNWSKVSRDGIVKYVTEREKIE